MSAFEGKVVMVTGATGNLGSAVARQFAAQGAKLALVARDADSLQALASELGGETMIEAADLGDVESVDGLVRRIEARFGGIDVLAHTVGGYAAGKPVHESSVDVLEKMIALNVRPVYVTAGRVARSMVERGQAGRPGGKIVVVLAKSGLKGSAKNAAYTASKAAAQRIVESMALELRDLGINVNAVLPSIIDSPQNRADMPNADPAKWVTPDDVADAILFLASDAASKISGASLEVYGRS